MPEAGIWDVHLDVVCCAVLSIVGAVLTVGMCVSCIDVLHVCGWNF